MAGPKVPLLLVLRTLCVLATVSGSYPSPSGSFRHYHPSATAQAKQQAASCYRSILACVRPAASVHLSHDQTLQFKSYAHELNWLNYVFTLETSVFIFRPRTLRIRIRVPTQIARINCYYVRRGFRSPSRGGVYYAFLFQSQP